MKLFAFLKGRSGKIALSLGRMAGTAVTAGVLGLSVYNYATDRPAAQDQRVRTLSGILREGGTLPGETGPSINISAGSVQFATAEERAAMEGASSVFDGGDSAVAGLENISAGNVRGSALGSGEAGLGMGANEAVEIGSGAGGANGGAGGGSREVSALAAAAEAARAAGANTLQSAQIARAAGNVLGSGNSGGFSAPSGAAGGTSGKGGASASGAGAGPSAYSLSGAMPEGSMLVASRSVQGQSSFGGADRDARVGRGIHSKEGNSLRKIALDSSAIAKDKNRAANEGTRPFLASEQRSGGIRTEDGAFGETAASSEDFEAEMNAREQGAAQAFEDKQLEELERKNHRSRLKKAMFTLLFATMAAMAAIATLMKGGIWSKIAAIAVGALMVTMIGFFIADAAKYISKYSSDGWSIASLLAGAIMLAGIGISYTGFFREWLVGTSKGAGGVLGKLGAKLGTTGSTIASGAVGTMAMKGIDSGIQSAKTVTSSDAETGALDSGKSDAKK